MGEWSLKDANIRGRQVQEGSDKICPSLYKLWWQKLPQSMTKSVPSVKFKSHSAEFLWPVHLSPLLRVSRQCQGPPTLPPPHPLIPQGPHSQHTLRPLELWPAPLLAAARSPSLPPLWPVSLPPLLPPVQPVSWSTLMRICHWWVDQLQSSK